MDIEGIVTVHGNLKDTVRLVEARNIFGDTRRVRGSKHDLVTLAKKVSKGPIKPRLYQCCGTEDFLYFENIHFRDAIRTLPLDLTYEEGPGDHHWAYWDKMIQNVLAWMFADKKRG